MLLPFFVADVIATFDVGRCCCHVWLVLLPLCGWCYCHFLMLADVIAMFGWCYCHNLLIDGTNCATVAVVMPHCGSDVFFWQILLPGLADVIAICCCVWQMSLPMWLVLLPFITCFVVFSWQIFLPGLADVIAICYCVWQMLLPIWLMLLPFITCYVRQMLFARVADGIAYPGGCGVWCYDHVWQIE